MKNANQFKDQFNVVISDTVEVYGQRATTKMRRWGGLSGDELLYVIGNFVKKSDGVKGFMLESKGKKSLERMVVDNSKEFEKIFGSELVEKCKKVLGIK